jgi:hypothetical protein
MLLTGKLMQARQNVNTILQHRGDSRAGQVCKGALLDGLDGSVITRDGDLWELILAAISIKCGLHSFLHLHTAVSLNNFIWSVHESTSIVCFGVW